jgi:hypothetical protein
MKVTFSNIAFFVLGALLFTAISAVSAWIGPGSAPPDGNVSAPVHVGAGDQIKAAGLGVNSLAVYGNAILSTVGGYLNFGVTAGSSGYGIRDNTGAMEVKNSGGTWGRIATTTSSGTVQSVKFTDGTTQTSAGGPGTFRNWEVRSQNCTAAWCVASCTGTKKVLGGGCSGSDHITYGYPYNANEAWRCRTEISTSIIAYAICADVD